MSQTELQILFKKFLEDNLSPQEFNRLYELVNNEYDPGELDALLESAFSNPAFAAGAGDYDRRAVFAEIMDSRTPVVPLNRRAWVRYASVVALLLICIGVGLLWRAYRKNPNTPVDVVNVYKNDVMPGGNHAILVLDNGTCIQLDSIEKGNLVDQGGTQVSKVNTGSLSYKVLSDNISNVFYNTVSTPVGGQYQITLADGTRVWLNALSMLKFPTSFNATARTVELTGEAYFEVAVNKSKPFHVKVNGMDVEVLGTAFNVNAYPDESSIKTTLLEGAVKLVKGKNDIMLKPGEQAQTTGESGLLLNKDVNVDQAIAWKNGHFSFDGSDIYGVMRQISRWYGVEVQYDGAVPGKSFDGTIGRDLNLTQVLTGLSRGGIHFRLEGTRLTVLP